MVKGHLWKLGLRDADGNNAWLIVMLSDAFCSRYKCYQIICVMCVLCGVPCVSVVFLPARH